MSDRENVISGLRYTVEMFLFDPATGYTKDPDDLNAADRITFDACVGAIDLLKEQEPKPVKVDTRKVLDGETERVVNDLNIAKLILCDPQTLTPAMCIRIGQAITSAIVLLKEQPEIVRCKDCKYCREAHYEEDGEPPIIKLKCENKYGLCRYQAEPDGFCSQGERKDGDENAVV